MKNSEHTCYKKAVQSLLPDLEQIRCNVVRNAKEYKSIKKKHAWLVPAVASVCAAIIICMAIPSVRAAITHWFKENFSIGNYVAQPSEERPTTPEIDGVIEQATPEGSIKTLEITEIDPAWKEWAEGLEPKVGDVYYDGNQLVVGFDMGGGAAEFIAGGSIGGGHGKEVQFPNSISMGNPAYIMLNGQVHGANCNAYVIESDVRSIYKYIDEETMSYTAEGVAAIQNAKSAKFFAQIDIGEMAEVPDNFGELSGEEQFRALQKAGATYHGGTITPDLKGIQEVEVFLPLILTDHSNPILADDSFSYEGTVIGKMRLTFSFDPKAAENACETIHINKAIAFKGTGTYTWADMNSDPEYYIFQNKTVDMAGVTMTVQKIEIMPSCSRLYIAFKGPDNWDEITKRGFLGSLTLVPRVYGDGVELPSYEQSFFEGEGVDEGWCMVLSMLPSEIKAIKTFEIVPTLSKANSINEIPMIKEQILKIRQGELEGGKQETTVLTNCTLKFSLKWE